MQTIEISAFRFWKHGNSQAVVTITEHTGFLWWRKIRVSRLRYHGHRSYWRSPDTGARAEGEVAELLEERWYVADLRLTLDQQRCIRDPDVR